MNGKISTPMFSVITPTIKGRENFLQECRGSVENQSLPLEHLVAVDENRDGPAAVRNKLSLKAQGEWLLPLDDDDLLDSDYLSTMAPFLVDVDIAYSWCRVEGMDWCPNRLFRPEALQRQNFIPVTALIRAEVFDQLGGYSSQARLEDWDLWLRALSGGFRFLCVPEVLWTYRIHGTDQRNLNP